MAIDLRRQDSKRVQAHAFALVALSLSCAATAPARAIPLDPARFSYWISLRGITEDAVPSFVVTSYSRGGAYTASFAGCDGHTYYLTASGAAIVQASRNSGDTVQIHRGNPGTQAAAAGIVCLVQADR